MNSFVSVKLTLPEGTTGPPVQVLGLTIVTIEEPRHALPTRAEDKVYQLDGPYD